MPNPVEQLIEYGQSPWLDTISRDLLDSGELSRLAVEDGIRGVTSNPTIFDQAISRSNTYDADIAANASDDPDTIFWDLATADVARGCDVLRPVYDRTDGGDGFVSIEVDPNLADDTDGTVAAALELHARIDRPNLLVKIPGTAAGVGAIEETIAAGHSVNVTLLFSVERHMETAEAYQRGLRRALDGGKDVSRIASVASFFVSRVDTLVDDLLAKEGSEAALDLQGKAAVANAKLAYQAFLAKFSGPRWEELAAAGARVQRPLWASTSTKNAGYSDVMYVEPLIGEHTVNTLTQATIEAFKHHGRPGSTIGTGIGEAEATMRALADVGVDIDDVTYELERDGVEKFVASFSDLLGSVREKRAAVHG